MKNHIRILSVCIASYPATLCAAEASDAEAQTHFRRFAANGACLPAGSSVISAFLGRVAVGVGQNSTALECGIPSDSELSHTNVTALAIHGKRSGTTSYSAAACVTGNFGVGMACGGSGAPPTGDFTHYISTVVWTNPAYATWYPYVTVSFASPNNLQGFYIRD